MSEYSWVPERIIQSVKAGLEAGLVKYKDLAAMETLAASENPERKALRQVLTRLRRYKGLPIEPPTAYEWQRWEKEQEQAQLEVSAIAPSEWLVSNRAKGTEYLVTEMDGTYSCDCVAAAMGGTCKHIARVQRQWKRSLVKVTELLDCVGPEPPNQIFVPGVGICDRVPEVPAPASNTEQEPVSGTDTPEKQGGAAPARNVEPKGVCDRTRDLQKGDSKIHSLARRFLEESIAGVRGPVGVPSASDTASILQGITLSPGQCEAAEAIARMVEACEVGVLSGFAGTGKTTVLQAAIALVLRSQPYKPIAFCAPTNKACKVASKMLRRWGLGEKVQVLTVHSLLGLRPKYREDKVTFEQDPKNPSHYESFSWVIVDESSMLNEPIYTLLRKAKHLFQALLFVGDSFQLPPVGEAIALPFEDVKGNRFELSQIMRYSGYLGEVVDQVRRTVDSEGGLPPLVEGAGVRVLSHEQAWESLAVRACRRACEDGDIDKARILAYTNRRVNELAARVREAIYPGMEPWVEGEWLIMREAWSNADTTIPTSEEGRVLDRTEFKAGELWVWAIEVDFGQPLGRKLIHVLQPRSEAAHKAYCDRLAKEKRWQEFWEEKERFASIAPPYALTAHKSQGSTYEATYIDVRNVLQTYHWQKERSGVDKTGERNRLLYTAFSRASQEINLLV